MSRHSNLLYSSEPVPFFELVFRESHTAMSSSRLLLQALSRRSALSLCRAQCTRAKNPYKAPASNRFLGTLNPNEDTQSEVKDEIKVENTKSSSEVESNGGKNDQQKPGAIGGFMRGLMGGQAVAVEDAFIAQAKEQGVELPPPPPPRKVDLVPVKKRKRREEEGDSTESIRDRIFGRFAGSAFMQGVFTAKERIAERIDESDNPIINMFRNVYDRLFAENEMGMVVREIREEDPTFRISEFLREVELDLVPQILGAYLAGDRENLKGRCTDEAFSMLNASIRERETEGIVMDTNILDVSDIELTAGRVLEDSPVLIVSFNTQQINCLRDKGGNIVEGREDDIRAVYYAWALVREAEYESVEPTGGGRDASADSDFGEKKEPAEDPKTDARDNSGQNNVRPWKLMEMVIRGAHSTI